MDSPCSSSISRKRPLLKGSGKLTFIFSDGSAREQTVSKVVIVRVMVSLKSVFPEFDSVLRMGEIPDLTFDIGHGLLLARRSDDQFYQILCPLKRVPEVWELLPYDWEDLDSLLCYRVY